jgi:DNA primase
MAGISRETIDHLRSSCDLIDFIDSYVPLKRMGRRAKCCCPFHKEKTPSFNVDGDKGFFKCFGCGVSGDVFKFVQLYENLDFPASIRRVGEKTGIPVPEDGPTVSSEEKSQREKLINLMGAVTKWWQKILLQEAAGEVARTYLKSREIGSELAREFSLGFAPEDWTATLDWGKTQGYSPELMNLAGLVTSQAESGRTYDRFRGRLMFPIANENGQVVAFSGRLLDPEAKAAKYVNSPETPLFTKSKILYGLDKTKRAILDSRKAVVCEGQIDLIRCYQHGIQNVVAAQGTAFTEHHTRLLKRYADEIILCFDADRAGQNAAARSVDLLIEQGLEVRIASMPAGEDPDTLLRKSGAEALRPRLDSAPDYTRHLLEVCCRENDPTSPRGRTLIAQKMAALVVKIPSPVRRQTVSLEIASRLQIPVSLFEQEIARLKTKPAAPRPAGITSEDPDEREEQSASLPPLEPHPLLAHLLSLLLRHPEVATHVQRTLSPLWLQGMEGSIAVLDLLEAISADEWEDVSPYIANRPEEERHALTALVVQPHPVPTDSSLERYADELITSIHRFSRRRRLLLVEQEIKSNLLPPNDLIKKLAELAVLRKEAVD